MKKTVLITLGLFLTIIQTANSAPEGLNENNMARFNQVIQVIQNNYVEPVADEKILKNALQGLMDGLDPHSEYLDPDALKELQTMTSGQFGGLGLEITMDDNFIKVVTPLDDTPAQKAGIKPGDIILRIDNFPTKGMTLREASKKMRGPKDSNVTLMILHKDKNKPIPIKLTRDDIKIQSVKSRLLEPGLGYLRITSFQTMTDVDVNAAIKKLNQENHTPLKGLILDLRNNPGGLLDVAAKVTNSFLDSRNLKENDLIVYTKGRTADSRMQLKAQPNDILFRAPLVVLINEGSASGAEIVAGALQDHKRALIVGTRSFGKGSVQTVIPLDDSTALKLTTALYYTPAGRSIQATGIVPDVKVDDLKITQATEDDWSNLYTKEADLRGHFANAQSEEGANAVVNKKIGSNKQMLVDDYQLTVALYLLKAMTVLPGSSVSQ